MKIVAVLYPGGDAAKEQPGLLGCVENELGIRQWLESQGHTYIVTHDKDAQDSELDKHLPDTDILISTPFHPAYLTPERFEKAKKLKLALTSGVGSDHIDLDSARKHGVSVVECTGSNVVSVAEHAVMSILVLIKNYIPAHQQIFEGGWNVSQIAKRAYDLEDKVVGTVGAGRIGYRILQRIKPFQCKKLVYFDYQPLSPELEKEVGVERVESFDDFLSQCDIITINCPLYDTTRGLFDEKALSKMKKGAYIVNTARGAIMNREALVKAVNSGHIAGYAGDVWDVQPAPEDHPWRTMANNGMTPHYSGTSLDAQKRYAQGTKEILEAFFHGDPFKPQDVIVQGGQVASASYGEKK
ncbi:formate dehydrogenase (NAD+) [Umbelopsis sp. WA50703]